MVFEKIRKILCEQLDLEEDDVTLESNIAEDLGGDSMDVVDLIMSIEDEFAIEVPDDQVENIKTVGDIVNYIENVKLFMLDCAAEFSAAFFLFMFVENMG